MTAEDKIKEAEYNLKKLQGSNLDPDFQYELSNFLSSSRSILDHLLEDHNKKFGFNLAHVNSKKFIDKADKMGNIDATKFINWYDDAIKKLKNEKSYGFLWDKRNHAVHQKTIKPDHAFRLELGLTPIWKDKVTGEKTIGERMPQEHTWRFFIENPDEEIIIVCEKFLTHIKKIVNDSQR